VPRNGGKRGGARACRGDVGLRPAPTNFVRPAIESYACIYNYSADAGAGSQLITNISESPGWRAMLLGTVAAGALWLGLPRHAKAGPEPCTVIGIAPNQTATCQGDQSDGITIAAATDFDPADVETLNVNNLTTDITPASTVDGIYFHRTGAGQNVIINSDTTPFDIIVTGAGADGIDAMSDAAITINHVGDIDASDGRDGIFAVGGAGVTITTGAGSTVMGRIGIAAGNNGSGGALTIIANGDVVGTAGVGNYGIYATNINGTDLSITTQSVTGGFGGIVALNEPGSTGAVTIITSGAVAGTTGIGILASNYDGTDLSVTSHAKVTGGTYGISAFSANGTGSLEIVANGDVEGISGMGIFTRNNAASTGPLSITSEGVTGGTTGIYARNYGTGAFEIVANGDVVGSGSFGVYARNYNPNSTTLSIISEGVTGGSHGIFAYSYGTGALTVVANGDVVGTSNDGIYARNANPVGNGPTMVTTEGVTGGINGIYARNTSIGALTIVANGDVTGTTSAGIYARAGGIGPATVTVGAGAIVAGGVAGVRFVEGEANTLNNFGSVRNLSGLGGTAILGGVGPETVNNFGVVTGNVLLGGGTNAFNNMAGGLFNSGTTVDLGVGNLLTNHGTLSPGGAGTILTTALTGDFAQPGSVFEVNLNGSLADRLDVSGSAALNGLVQPLFTLSGLTSATQRTILTSGTPIVDNGISAVSTPVVQFDLIFPTSTQMDLVLDLDFAVDGLNRNETAIAENLNKVFATGNFGGLDALLTAISVLPTEAAVANALDQLSPEIYLDTEIATLFSSLAFTNSLMTCPVRDGAAAFIKEGECVWARLSGRQFDQDATFQTLGFDERSFEVAGGVQGALGEVWRVGFAGAYEQSFLDTDQTFVSSDADRIHGGAVLKYNPGALLLAGAVSGGFGWYDTERPIAFPGFMALAQSEHEVGYLNGRLRAEYLLSAGTWYAKPMVDLDATHISLDGVSETGAGAVGLNVRGSDETVLSATPALEIGAQFGSPNGTLVRPYVRGGATVFDDPDFVLLASFEGAPGGVGPFRIATSTDDVLANVGAGVDVIGSEGASFRIYYEGRFGDLVEQHAGGIKASLPF